MPLKSGKSKTTVSANISELMTGPMGSTRAKGMRTMMKKGMSASKARQKQSIAIAMSKAGLSKNKKKKKKKIKK